MQAEVCPLPYYLDECPIPWPDVSTDYPFQAMHDDSPEEFLTKRYLETLWLPPSISSLGQLVHSLRRIACPSTSSHHPLHALLDPLLLDLASIESKYHVELPLILKQGGGSGDIEEAMMWHAWNHGKNNSEKTDDEESWRKQWLFSMEKREVMIQILLHYMKLSLPPLLLEPRPLKRRRRGRSLTPEASTDTNLDMLTDRMSIWQAIEEGSSSRDRDWVQVFCEDVVGSLFKECLPNLYAQFEIKVAPRSRASSPSSPNSPPMLLAKTKCRKHSRPPSPLSLPEIRRTNSLTRTSTLPDIPRAPSRLRSKSPTPSDFGFGAQSVTGSNSTAIRRSRSQSVTASAEEIKARGGNRGGIVTSKKLFNEVEMRRRVAKPKPAPQPNHQGQPRKLASSAGGDAVESSSGPLTLVVDTPVKDKTRVKREEESLSFIMDSPDRGQTDSPDQLLLSMGAVRRDKVLVMDTPTKRRTT